MIIPPRIQLARLPTPLVPLDRLSAELGGPRIWLKRDDLTETAASGNKIRKLEFSLAAAREASADVLITCGGIQSNHCRATALLARQLGFEVHLLLRGTRPDQADGNLLLDELLGATITFATREEYADLPALVARTEQAWIEAGRKPFFIPTGASDEIGLWGYITATSELKQDFLDRGINPEAVVSATGSGGTLGGLIIGRQLAEVDTRMMAFNVCDDEAYFITKIREDLQRWQARYDHQLDDANLDINVIDGYVGPGYGRADKQVFKTIRRLAITEGIILDPVYTGKAFDALLTEISAGRFRGAADIVFIHTGGIFGLFPQRNQF
ncbi:MAG: 1-aminocyclopropane-1-carboxylate deaminase/D-cysteine desulfhydrase [Pseudomonadota bacterium]